MAREGRSARTRDQRIARRRQETRGYDEGGGSRPFYRKRWFKPVIAIGVVGILASLIGGSLFVLTGADPHSGSSVSSGSTQDPIVRRGDEQSVAQAALLDEEEKPTFEAPPPLTLDPEIDYRAVLQLESGTVEIDLLEDLAPVHVNNFIFLAEQGFFDRLTFHRVLENFVAQTGDPTATGTGGAGYVLPDEAPDLSGGLTLGAPGVLAMARSGAGASSSQFFITLSPQAQLDNLSFTAFGVVTTGIEFVQDLPLRDPTTLPPPPPGALVLSVSIQESPKTAAGAETGDASDADEEAAE